MYESFYGLKDKPFSILPDPEYLYLSKQHQMALTLLEYSLVNHASFCVITGEPGAGKTTLIRKLLENISDRYAIGLITNTHKSFGELLDWVLSAYSIHESGLSQVEKNQKFTDFLMQQYAQGKTTLLIVDEAQNMAADMLEELRMLSNVNSEKDQLLQIILSGQPELKDTLRKPELMQFAQRISVDYHLKTLNKLETCHYIQHRLMTAGAEQDVFTPKACMRVHEFSGGTPRLINLICDTAMVYGFADQIKLIDKDIVEEMVRERMQDSAVPLFKNTDKVSGEPDNNSDKNQPEVESDDHDFPWINPDGGTQGIKPEAEKKTLELPVTESQQTEVLQTTSDGPEAPIKNKQSQGEQASTQDNASETDDEINNSQQDGTADLHTQSHDELTQSDVSTNTQDYSVEAQADTHDQEKSRKKVWVLGVLTLLCILVTVVIIAINNNHKIERQQKLAEEKLQQIIEQRAADSAKLEKKLQAAQQAKQDVEQQLLIKADELEQRDAELEQAKQQAIEKLRQEKRMKKAQYEEKLKNQQTAIEAKRWVREKKEVLKKQQELTQTIMQQQQQIEQLNRAQQLPAKIEKENATLLNKNAQSQQAKQQAQQNQ